MATEGVSSLYERLGGVYSIATVIDDFIDRIMVDPRLNTNPRVDEAHHRVPPAGFKYLVTEMVCWATGGPQKYTGRSMKDSHQNLMITATEWEAFLDDLQQTLGLLLRQGLPPHATYLFKHALVQDVAHGSLLRVQPVFQAMLKNALRLCDAKFENIYRWDGDALHLVATQNVPAAFVQVRGRAPLRPSPQTPTGRMIVTKTVVHVADMRAEKAHADRDPYIVAGVELGGVRSALVVPMLKDDELIDSFSVYRQEVRAFTDKQIALVQNFATQAVIAIENARLLSELRETLQQKTATADVLKIISRSTFDLPKVLNTLLEWAARLCEADKGVILRPSGDASYYAAAIYHHTPEFIESQMGIVFTPGRSGVVGRVLLEGKSVQIPDVLSDPEYAFGEFARLGDFRTILGVPLVREEIPIGLFVLHRAAVRPFTEKQINLVETFADQAVIAMENNRLLNELRQRTTDLTERTADLTEALDQQTATSEVLQVISSSPGDLQPVFATMLEKAVTICEARFGDIYRWDGDALCLVANHNTPPAFAEERKRSQYVRPVPGPPGTSIMVVMLATKSLVHVADLAAEQAYIEQRNPTYAAAVELGGVRTILLVPMLKENELIGAFILCRQEVRRFTDKQIVLVTNFAAQAVIAIENARLLNELRQRTDDLGETLEQQTASARVLEVISRSAFDLHAVFETVAESSVRLCEADRAFIFQYDGELLRVKAFYNASPELADWVREHPVRPGSHLASARAALHRQTIHIPDVQVDPDYLHGGKLVDAFRTVLAVPILKSDDLLGVILIYRLDVQPFTEKQIALVETFADQAAIAIENTRLLQELRQRTDEVVNLNQQLEQRVADQVGEIERMSRLRRFLPPQVADLIVASGSEKQLESHRREITALFCDLRGFTGFTESADAEDVMALLRDYHAAIGEIIIKYSGTLERYAGDGVMVVFNDPVPVENPALQAVLMALELRNALGALTQTWSRLGHEIGFGIGIAHGFATLGTIGYEGRFDYAAIGTVSNVASRLCDEAKPGQILISAASADEGGECRQGRACR